MAAGSATAMARSTIPPAAFAKARPPKIWKCRLTPSCLTPVSRSVEEHTHVRSIDLYPQVRHREVARPAPAAAAPDARHHEHLPDAEEPEFLVRLRRHPHRLPGGAD